MSGVKAPDTRDLERRLSEAEATIEALLAGQIDAVVDPTTRTPVLLAKAQGALRDERNRAQRYLDTPDVILLALDLDMKVTLANRYACAVLGWSPRELLGRNWVETCLPVWLRGTFKATFHDMLRGDRPDAENAVITRSGEERLIGWRNTLLRDDNGAVVGTFSAGADITERHRAVAALRTAEERMRFALEAAGVGIWDMDYATGLLRWSTILESQCGLAPGTFGGTFENAIEGVHPDDRTSVIETFERAMKSGADFSIENRAVWPDGTVRWLSGSGRVHLGDHGEPVRGVGISQDVTARRMLEEQYQQAQKMEAVGRLAGGVAHDFNNVLTVILGYCELLLADADPDERRQSDIAEIQKAGTSASLLTRQLLAFSRKEIIEPTRIDLNVLIAGMRAMIERLIGENVRVVLDLRPGLACLKADRGQVEQIILNLAVNARDAMPAGGTLTLETATVDLDVNDSRAQPAVPPGVYVALTVADTGTGMTPQVRSRLFEPFFTTKDAGKGTGLGLATVHGIVIRSGGSVGVSSEVGKGTSFKVYFPVSAAEEVDVEAEAPAARPAAATEIVLVVDDAEGIRLLAKRLLQRQGYKVLLAADANAAFQLFEENPSIDVLLTDVVMPGASGPELTKHLVGRCPALKVIYMSGYTEDAIAHHGVLDPGIAFLHKPFTSETLGQKIRDVLDR